MSNNIIETDREVSEGSNGVRKWWQPVGVIVRLELRQRLRTTRWRITIAVLFLLLSLIMFGSLYLVVTVSRDTYAEWSANAYPLLVGVILFIGLILAPTLAATSINGDRKDATLALVQATTISNLQLALGKLLGNWAASCVLIIVGLPYLIWAIVVAPYGIWASILGVLVMIILFGCYSAVGLGISALTARPAGSAVITQATVFFLILGLPAVFGLLLDSTKERHTVVEKHYTYSQSSPDFDERTERCHETRSKVSYEHSEKIWWLLAPNPFLIAADSVAAYDIPPDRTYSASKTETPLYGSIARPFARSLAEARNGPMIFDERCGRSTFTSQQGRNRVDSLIGRSWYLGLAANVVLGALGLLLATRRLRVPAAKLPRGVRIA